MTGQTSLVPKRRFKEFQNTHDWEQRKFLDNVKNIVDFRGRTPKKLGLDWSVTGYLALSALNVKDGYIDPSADAHYGNQELYDRWMTGHELRKGQVLFTTEAPMGNVAQVPDNTPYILSQRTIAFDVEPEKMMDDFLFVLLRSPNVYSALSALSSGGTAKGVSQKSMSQLSVTVPKNLFEQNQIASFFKGINDLITLHQGKLEKTKALKSAYLSEMFPAEGERVPKRRFAGFTDLWEQRKVGDIGTIQTCKRIFKEQTSESEDIPFYKNGTLGKQADSYISREVFDEFKELYPFPEIGDVLMSVVGSIGRTAEYMGEDEYFQDSNIVWLKTNKDEINRKFLKISYQIINWIIEGSTIKHLYNDNILLSQIWLPSISEQEQIGAFFETFDNLITLHQRKLEKLQNLKKAYLNEMFV